MNTSALEQRLTVIEDALAELMPSLRPKVTRKQPPKIVKIGEGLTGEKLYHENVGAGIPYIELKAVKTLLDIIETNFDSWMLRISDPEAVETIQHLKDKVSRHLLGDMPDEKSA